MCTFQVGQGRVIGALEQVCFAQQTGRRSHTHGASKQLAMDNA